MSFGRFVPLCILALLSPGIALAQSPMPQTSTVVRLSVGGGWAGPAAVVHAHRPMGPTLALGVERALLPTLRGLVEVTRWQTTGAPGSSATFATASAELVPVQGTDAYVRAGFGYGSGSLYAPSIALNGGGYSVAGPAVQIGGGYDYRASNAFSVGAFVASTNTVGGTAKSKVRFGTGEVALTSIGLSLNWRL